MTTPRDVVLSRIRQALEGQEASSPPRGSCEGTATEAREELLSRLVDRLRDYGSSVTRCAPGDLSESIAGTLEGRGLGSLVAPSELPSDWLAEAGKWGMKLLRDPADRGEGPPEALTKDELAAVHGVITGCSMAIAETGTIVLQAGGERGRRALTLLPDYHLCVVFGSQVVGTVPQAVALMGQGILDGEGSLTLVSGPSATSDIELIRVQGVHGPRTLDVIVVADP